MSGNSLERLIYMANHIGREFSNQQPKMAVEATYDHLWHFWDPRMKEMIISHWKAGGTGLTDIAMRAVEQLATHTGEPPSVTRATEFSGRDGSRMSDAG
jgi:formate dehydrogenase subunit delta